MGTSRFDRVPEHLRAQLGKRLSRRDLGKSAGAAAAVAGISLAGSELARAQDSAPSGSIAISLAAEPSTLEWWNSFSIDGHPVLRNTFESLLNRDPLTNELVGELATAWEWQDDRTLRFTLRQGVTFHNGEAFNADVAAFGINYTWAPENAFDIAQFMGSQITATVVDEYTIDVQTNEPDPILPATLYFGTIPSKRQIEEDPDSLVDSPIGTGPYQFVEWARGERIALTAYPDWWGHGAEDARGTVTIQDVEYVWRTESAVRAAQVTAGEVQIARFLGPDECAGSPVCKEAISVETVPLRLDTPHPTLGDIRIRQAIAHAVDTQQVVESLFGSGSVATQLVGPSAAGYNADLQPTPYDPDTARALIEEAAAEGVDTSAALVVAVRRGSYLRAEELGQYVAGALTEVGLNVTAEIIEHGAYQEQFIMPLEDIPADRGWIATLSHGNEVMDVGGTAASWYRCSGGVASYCDPEVDALIDAANPLTGEERATAFAEVTRAFQEGFSIVPIAHLAFLYGTSEEVVWEPRLDGFMLLKEMSLAG